MGLKRFNIAINSRASSSAGSCSATSCTAG